MMMEKKNNNMAQLKPSEGQRSRSSSFDSSSTETSSSFACSSSNSGLSSMGVQERRHVDGGWLLGGPMQEEGGKRRGQRRKGKKSEKGGEGGKSSDHGGDVAPGDGGGKEGEGRRGGDQDLRGPREEGKEQEKMVDRQTHDPSASAQDPSASMSHLSLDEEVPSQLPSSPQKQTPCLSSLLPPPPPSTHHGMSTDSDSFLSSEEYASPNSTSSRPLSSGLLTPTASPDRPQKTQHPPSSTTTTITPPHTPLRTIPYRPIPRRPPPSPPSRTQAGRLLDLHPLLRPHDFPQQTQRRTDITASPIHKSRRLTSHDMDGTSPIHVYLREKIVFDLRSTNRSHRLFARCLHHGDPRVRLGELLEGQMFVWQAQLVGYWYVQDDVSPELSCMISVVDGTQEVGGQGEEGGSMAGKGESGWTFEEDREVGKSKGNRKGKGRGRAPAAAAAKTRQDGTLETPGDCQEGRPCAVKDEGEEVEGKKARALSVEEKKRRALAEAKEIDRLALEIEALRTEVLTAGGIGKAGKAGKKEKRGKGRTRAREGQGRMAEDVVPKTPVPISANDKTIVISAGAVESLPVISMQAAKNRDPAEEALEVFGQDGAGTENVSVGKVGRAEGIEEGAKDCVQAAVGKEGEMVGEGNEDNARSGLEVASRGCETERDQGGGADSVALKVEEKKKKECRNKRKKKGAQRAAMEREMQGVLDQVIDAALVLPSGPAIAVLPPTPPSLVNTTTSSTTLTTCLSTPPPASMINSLSATSPRTSRTSPPASLRPHTAPPISSSQPHHSSPTSPSSQTSASPTITPFVTSLVTTLVHDLTSKLASRQVSEADYGDWPAEELLEWEEVPSKVNLKKHPYKAHGSTSPFSSTPSSPSFSPTCSSHTPASSPVQPKDDHHQYHQSLSQPYTSLPSRPVDKLQDHLSPNICHIIRTFPDSCAPPATLPAPHDSHHDQPYRAPPGASSNTATYITANPYPSHSGHFRSQTPTPPHSPPPLALPPPQCPRDLLPLPATSRSAPSTSRQAQLTFRQAQHTPESLPTSSKPTHSTSRPDQPPPKLVQSAVSPPLTRTCAGPQVSAATPDRNAQLQATTSRAPVNYVSFSCSLPQAPPSTSPSSLTSPQQTTSTHTRANPTISGLRPSRHPKNNPRRSSPTLTPHSPARTSSPPCPPLPSSPSADSSVGRHARIVSDQAMYMSSTSPGNLRMPPLPAPPSASSSAATPHLPLAQAKNADSPLFQSPHSLPTYPPYPSPLASPQSPSRQVHAPSLPFLPHDEQTERPPQSPAIQRPGPFSRSLYQRWAQDEGGKIDENFQVSFGTFPAQESSQRATRALQRLRGQMAGEVGREGHVCRRVQELTGGQLDGGRVPESGPVEGRNPRNSPRPADLPEPHVTKFRADARMMGRDMEQEGLGVEGPRDVTADAIQATQQTAVSSPQTRVPTVSVLSSLSSPSFLPHPLFPTRNDTQEVSLNSAPRAYAVESMTLSPRQQQQLPHSCGASLSPPQHSSRSNQKSPSSALSAVPSQQVITASAAELIMHNEPPPAPALTSAKGDLADKVSQYSVQIGQVQGKSWGRQGHLLEDCSGILTTLALNSDYFTSSRSAVSHLLAPHRATGPRREGGQEQKEPPLVERISSTVAPPSKPADGVAILPTKQEDPPSTNVRATKQRASSSTNASPSKQCDPSCAIAPAITQCGKQALAAPSSKQVVPLSIDSAPTHDGDKPAAIGPLSKQGALPAIAAPSMQQYCHPSMAPSSHQPNVIAPPVPQGSELERMGPCSPQGTDELAALTLPADQTTRSLTAACEDMGKGSHSGLVIMDKGEKIEKKGSVVEKGRASTELRGQTTKLAREDLHSGKGLPNALGGEGEGQETREGGSRMARAGSMKVAMGDRLRTAESISGSKVSGLGQGGKEALPVAAAEAAGLVRCGLEQLEKKCREHWAKFIAEATGGYVMIAGERLEIVTIGGGEEERKGKKGGKKGRKGKGVWGVGGSRDPAEKGPRGQARKTAESEEGHVAKTPSTHGASTTASSVPATNDGWTHRPPRHRQRQGIWNGNAEENSQKWDGVESTLGQSAQWRQGEHQAGRRRRSRGEVQGEGRGCPPRG